MIALKKSGWKSTALTSSRLKNVLNAIAPAGSDCAPLRYAEICGLLQWLHGADAKQLGTEQAAVLEQFLALIKLSISVLPLPNPASSATSMSCSEAQERRLIVHTVYGMQNLVGANANFTKYFTDTLAVLFERKRRMMDSAKQEGSGRASSPAISPSPGPVLRGPRLHSSRLVESPLLSTRRARSKIVFASSPDTPFSDFILNCFSASRPGRLLGQGRYAPLGPAYSWCRDGSEAPGVSSHDIRRVLSGMHRLNSEHEEVRLLLQIVAEEWLPLCNSDLTAHQVSLAFSGLHRMRSCYSEVRLVVMALTSSLMNCFQNFSTEDIMRLMSGAQCCEQDHPELQRRLLAVVMSKLRYNSTLAAGEEALSVPVFSRAVGGLRNTSSRSAEGSRLLKRLLRNLRLKQESPALEFGPHDVALCLSGVRRLDKDDKTVHDLLRTLTSGVIYSNNAEWTTAAVCSLLRQLGSMSLSSDEAEVCNLLAAVTNKLRAALVLCPLTDRGLGDAVFGLRRMDSNSAEVLALVGVLADALQAGVALTALCGEDATGGGTPKESLILWCPGKSYGDVLHGLRHIATHHSEMDRFLSAFSVHLNTHTRPLSTEGVSQLLLQLRHVTVQSASSRQLVVALTALVKRCSDSRFTSRQIALCMFGLSELSNELSEVQSLLGAIHLKVLHRKTRMCGDDLCLALYGLKSCTHGHREVHVILNSLKHKLYANYEKPAQPWEDYARMLPACHAGMLSAVLSHQSNPAFSVHAIATALEGLRGLCGNLCKGRDLRQDDDEDVLLTRKRVHQLQATLLTKLKYTNAPLNLTHLSMILNSLRYNNSEYYLDQRETNALKLLAYKCKRTLCVTPASNYQEQIGFVLLHLRRLKVKNHWNKVILLNAIFPHLDQAEMPLDYVNMMMVLHLLINSKVDHINGHAANSTHDTLEHLAGHLKETLRLRDLATTASADRKRPWTSSQVQEMRALLDRIRRSKPFEPAAVDEIRYLLTELESSY